MGRKVKFEISLPSVNFVKWSFVLLVAIAAGFAAFNFAKRDRVVATVGSLPISARDVERRNAVLRVFYPSENGDHGLKLLIDAYKAAEVARLYGYPIDEKALRDEEVRIDRNTRDPATLAKVKEIFGSDKDAYRRVFVLPTLAERVIFSEVFSRTPKIHAEQYDKANKFIISLGGSGAKLAEAARAAGVPVRQMTITSDGAFNWHATRSKLEPREASVPGPESQGAPADVRAAVAQKFGGQDADAAKFWIEQFAKMKPGALYPSPVDEQENLLVVRYIGPQGSKNKSHLVEVASFPKADFSAWLEREGAKISVKIK